MMMTHAPAPQKNTPKPLNRWNWWIMFALSTYAMSLCFQTFRDFTKIPDAPHGLLWVGSFILLAPPLLLLIYDSYVQEKGRGRVTRPIRLFDWMMRKRFLLSATEEMKS